LIRFLLLQPFSKFNFAGPLVKLCIFTFESFPQLHLSIRIPLFLMTVQLPAVLVFPKAPGGIGHSRCNQLSRHQHDPTFSLPAFWLVPEPHFRRLSINPNASGTFSCCGEIARHSMSFLTLPFFFRLSGVLLACVESAPCFFIGRNSSATSVFPLRLPGVLRSPRSKRLIPFPGFKPLFSPTGKPVDWARRDPGVVPFCISSSTPRALARSTPRRGPFSFGPPKKTCGKQKRFNRVQPSSLLLAPFFSPSFCTSFIDVRSQPFQVPSKSFPFYASTMAWCSQNRTNFFPRSSSSFPPGVAPMFMFIL